MQYFLSLLFCQQCFVSNDEDTIEFYCLLAFLVIFLECSICNVYLSCLYLILKTRVWVVKIQVWIQCYLFFGRSLITTEASESDNEKVRRMRSIVTGNTEVIIFLSLNSQVHTLLRKIQCNIKNFIKSTNQETEKNLRCFKYSWFIDYWGIFYLSNSFCFFTIG